jgi:hypothetical protein
VLVVSAIYKSQGDAQRVETLYRDLLRGWPVPNEPRTLSTRHGDTFVITFGPPHARRGCWAPTAPACTNASVRWV